MTQNQTAVVIDKSVVKRGLLTLFILLIFTVGKYIPNPAIDPAIESAGGSFSIFRLGIYPFLVSYILLYILMILIPGRNKDYAEILIQQRKIAIWVKPLTVLLFVYDAIGLYVLISRHYFDLDITIASMLLIILVFVAGGMFVIYLAELINEKGIGNGYLLIFATGSFLSFFKPLYWEYQQYTESVNGVHVMLIIIMISLIIALLNVFHKMTAEIPVKNKSAENNSHEKQRVHLKWVDFSSIKDMVFLIFIVYHIGSSIPLLFTQLIYYLASGSKLISQLKISPGGTAYHILNFSFITLLSFFYFYKRIYPVRAMVHKLNDQQLTIADIKDDQLFSYLCQKMRRNWVILFISLTIGLIEIFPEIIDFLFPKLPGPFGFPFRGYSFIIIFFTAMNIINDIRRR